MPQKSNPISAEVVIGFGIMAQHYAAAMLRAMEAGHERAAGEWQVEWQAVPATCLAVAGALRSAVSLVEGLRVFPDRMRGNLDADGGRIMAEAYMMTLAGQLGREHAHEVLYQAVRDSRSTRTTLSQALRAALSPEMWGRVEADLPQPEAYLGATAEITWTTIDRWRSADLHHCQCPDAATTPEERRS